MRHRLARLRLRRGVFALAAAGVVAAFSSPGATFDGADANDATTRTESASVSDASFTPGSTGDGSSPDQTGGGGSVNNEVVLLNLTDGRFAHRAGTGIARVTGGDVTNTNSAAATSSCTDCRTVAVAVQIVLVMGDSNYIAPTNQAVAINNNCLRCHSYALAYQYVVTTGGVVYFTPDGEQRLADLEARIRALTATELPFLELEAQIDALVEEMWDVVDNEVVKVGLNPHGSAAKDSDRADEDDLASPSPSPRPLSTPTDGPDASPSPTDFGPTPAPTPSPTPTPSPEPTPSS